MINIPALLAAALLTALSLGPAEAGRKRAAAPAKLDADTVNGAEPGRQSRAGIDPFAIRTAILLDRAGFSPGTIDGRWGENLAGALRSFQAARSLQASGRVDGETWTKLSADTAPALAPKPIEKADLQGPFVERIPSRLEDMRGLKSLGYRTPREALAERHHMSEGLLAALNPGQSFGATGGSILVAQVGGSRADAKAARVEVDKARRVVSAFAADGTLLSTYPASVGSTEKPAPSGRLEVRAVAENPTYTYNPAYGFRGVLAKEKFDIAGGPNSPVGSVWIALSAEGIGIHGTAEPDKVGKSFSHGCIRLTNWDAEELARMVKRGVPVDFKD